jgi:hypothetical protein
MSPKASAQDYQKKAARCEVAEAKAELAKALNTSLPMFIIK